MTPGPTATYYLLHKALVPLTLTPYVLAKIQFVFTSISSPVPSLFSIMSPYASTTSRPLPEKCIDRVAVRFLIPEL